MTPDKAINHTIHFLRMEIEALKHDNERWADTSSELATENAALAKRVEELETAYADEMAASKGFFHENEDLHKRVKRYEELVRIMALCHDPTRPDFDSVFINNKHCRKAKAALEDKQ